MGVNFIENSPISRDPLIRQARPEVDLRDRGSTDRCRVLDLMLGITLAGTKAGGLNTLLPAQQQSRS